jgi:ribonuclease P protein component
VKPQPDCRPTLSRRQRLRKTSDFQAVYGARARAGDGRLVAYARPNGLAVTRLGVSVGRRCGGSVQRNRIKRLVREAFRQIRAGFPAGYDVVVVPLVREYSLADVERSLKALVADAIRRSQAAARHAGAPDGTAT